MVAQAHIDNTYGLHGPWEQQQFICLGSRSACLGDVFFYPVLFTLFSCIRIHPCLLMQQLVFLHSAACIYWLLLSIYCVSCFAGGYFMYVIRIRIRKSFIAKCVCTHKEFVLVLGASSTESTNIVQTTYNQWWAVRGSRAFSAGLIKKIV